VRGLSLIAPGGCGRLRGCHRRASRQSKQACHRC
jgi:hypothetical protein